MIFVGEGSLQRSDLTAESRRQGFYPQLYISMRSLDEMIEKPFGMFEQIGTPWICQRCPQISDFGDNLLLNVGENS